MATQKYFAALLILLTLLIIFQGCIDNSSNSANASVKGEKAEKESFEKESIEKRENTEIREEESLEKGENEEKFENERNEIKEGEETGNSNLSVNLSVVGNITLQELSKHNSRNDCWMAINGKVYDVTSFIEEHPGGEAILQGCGKDATNLYMTRPMGSGTPHSSNANSLLKNYYIGDLVQ